MGQRFDSGSCPRCFARAPFTASVRRCKLRRADSTSQVGPRRRLTAVWWWGLELLAQGVDGGPGAGGELQVEPGVGVVEVAAGDIPDPLQPMRKVLRCSDSFFAVLS